MSVRTFAYIEAVTFVISTLGTCSMNILVCTVDATSALIASTILAKGLTFLAQALITDCIEGF